MASVSPPQARADAFVRVLLPIALVGLAPTGCYTGIDDPEATPWITAASDAGGSSGADADADADAGDADEGASAADGASSADGASDAGDAASDAGSAADGGTSGGDGGSADAGTDDGASGVDTGSDSGSVDGGSAEEGTSGGDDGGAAEVPDNAFCDPVAAWTPAWSVLEQQILDIVNQRRSEGADCHSEGTFGPAGPLTMNPALRCAARVHSKDMVDQNYFDHTGPNGDTPGDRIDAAGYAWSTWGENIAAGNSTAAATMDQWMNSDGHCANIMNPSFSEIGVGYYPGGGYGHYWTQAFGHP